jgi:hypothetical protein
MYRTSRIPQSDGETESVRRPLRIAHGSLFPKHLIQTEKCYVSEHHCSALPSINSPSNNLDNSEDHQKREPVAWGGLLLVCLSLLTRPGIASRFWSFRFVCQGCRRH